MEFIVNGYDYTDVDALKRRTNAREEHVVGIKRMIESKNMLYAAAMLNEKGDMCGSVMFVDFNSREELDEWLKVESYILNKVWEKVEVIPCKIPPIFLG